MTIFDEMEDHTSMSKLRQDYSPHEHLFEDLTRCMRGPVQGYPCIRLLSSRFSNFKQNFDL